MTNRAKLITTATDHQEPHPHPNPPPEGEGIFRVFPTFMGGFSYSSPVKGEVRRGMG
jgi:hypothetical protein